MMATHEATHAEHPMTPGKSFTAPRRHLVTGGTGLVGGALILELLDRTDDEIIALVRPGKAGSAEARLDAALREAARAYGRDPALLPLHRVRAVAGDVTLPGCGVEEALDADTMWHVAASLRYEDRYIEEIRRINVDGTRHVIALARDAGVRFFNHVSTAYVSGGREGRLLEVTRDASYVQNHYERSKIEAEALVSACADFQVRILRPSIVVGHSRTLAVTTFSGLYSFTRKMMQYRGVLERVQKGLSRSHRMHIRADADAPIDLIPVDEVAAQAVAIGTDPAAHGIFHLTQASPPTVGDAITAIATEVGFAPPVFVPADTPLDWLDEQFDKGLDFYRAYIRTWRVYDRTSSDAALGARRAETGRVLPPVRAMVAWYAEALEKERRALPVAR
jgi:nucleoside-diphosphate-sugar epimerase